MAGRIQVMTYMRQSLDDNRDSAGEVSATLLAEDAARQTQRDLLGANSTLGEGPHVLDCGVAEPVDGLGIVAHDGDGGTAVAEGVDDVGLNGVGVLKLVDEDMVES